MSRPLLVTDCDEVLLHMVVPFAGWLDETHHIHFDLESGDFVNALRHKACGTVVEAGRMWELLRGFFDTEMHRQQPIDGALETLHALAVHADVVVLTNLDDSEREGRIHQLRAVGVEFPVFTNQGGKGEAISRIIADYAPSTTVFVDDLAHQHDSVAKHAPDVWRLHMVGEPRLAPRIKPAASAHARIDRWPDAQGWILGRFNGDPL